MFSEGSLSQLSDIPNETEHSELRECGRVFRDLIGRLIFKCSICPKAFTLIAEYAMHLDQHPLPSKILCEKNPKRDILEIANPKQDPPPTLVKPTVKLVCGVTFSSGEDSDDNLADSSFSTLNKPVERAIMPCSNITHPEPLIEPHTTAKRANRRIQSQELLPPAFEPRSMESIPRISYTPCKHCNKRFSSMQMLNAHTNQFVSATEPSQHICSVIGCGRKFEADCLLQRHLINKHSVEKRKFACEICGKRYVYQFTLKQHLDSHTGNKPYKCDVCDKSFPHLAYIKIHMRFHTGERPYQCSLCGETFITSSKLSSHMRRRHVGNWKAHQCQICDKKFQYPRQLREHKVTHTNDRPYTCEVCCKSFTLPKYIAIHMQTHSGVKPYKCRYCDITFAQLPNRRQHEKLKHERRPEYDDLVLD